MKKILTPYKMPFVFMRGNRYYKIEDKLYPGVSLILKRLDIAQTYKQSDGDKARMQRGTLIHELIESLLTTDRDFDELLAEKAEKIASDENLLQEFLPYAFQAKSVKEDVLKGMNVNLVESVVWSKQYDFAGTIDCFCSTTSKKIIVDWKTSEFAKQSEVHIYQMAAYAIALEECFGQKAKVGMNVFIRPNRIEIAEKNLETHIKVLKKLLECF